VTWPCNQFHDQQSVVKKVYYNCALITWYWDCWWHSTFHIQFPVAQNTCSSQTLCHSSCKYGTCLCSL